MQNNQIPRRLPVPFGAEAEANYTRQVPVDTTTEGAASYRKGFPPETFQPVASGGVPPSGKDVNGVLFDATAWARWQAVGGAAQFDATFAAAVGGYPRYAVLASQTPGRFWQSLVDNNTTNPDAGGANWLRVANSPGPDDQNYFTIGNKLVQWGIVSSSSTGEPVVGAGFITPFAGSPVVVVTGFINAPSGRADTWAQLISSSVTSAGFSVQYQRGAGDTSPRLDGFTWQATGIAPQ